MIGQHFKSVIAKDWEKYLGNIQAGTSVAVLDPKKHQFEVFAPIELGRTGKPWSVMIQVKQDTVLADAIALDEDLSAAGWKSTYMLIAAGLATSVLAIFLLWYAAGGLPAPFAGPSKCSKISPRAKAVHQTTGDQRGRRSR